MISGLRLLVFSSIIFSYLIPIQAQQNQPSEQPKFDFDVEHDLVVEIKEQANTVTPFFVGSVNEKSVKVGSKVRFKLRIKNIGQIPFEFDKIQLGCRCLSVHLPTNLIKPGEFVSGVVDYHVDREKNKKYAANINFIKAERSVGSISLSGPLENVLEIMARQVYECEGAIGIWEIPILCTSPAEPENLKASVSDSLRDVELSIGKNAEGPIVILKCPAASLGLTGIAGQLMVEETKQDIKTSTAITLVKRPPVRISPLAARFVRKSGEEEFQAMGLIQALTSPGLSSVDKNAPSASASTSQQNSNRILNVKCVSSEPKLRLRVETVSINESLNRVKLFASVDKIKIEEAELTWTVETSEGVFSVKGTGYFLEN